MNALMICFAMGLLATSLLWLAGMRGWIFVVAIAALFGGGIIFEKLRLVQGAHEARRPLRAVPSLASTRHAFTGRFTGGERWLAMADSMAARGNTADAAGILIAAVKQHPRDYSLWTGLGTMLTEHQGALNPGAELAFERAIALAPGYPTPRYFYGLAKLRSGDRAGALVQWRVVLAAAPANASWRGLVEDRVKATEAAPTTPG